MSLSLAPTAQRHLPRASEDAATSQQLSVDPQPAATVVLLRDDDEGLQTLLLRRPVQAEFAADAHVFPGGRVDPADDDPAWDELAGTSLPAVTMVLEAQAGSAGQGPSARAFVIAAVREAFEETTVLIGAQARSLPAADWAAVARQRVHRNESSFADVLHEGEIRLDLSGIVYFDRWITPAPMPRRYDTRFFAAELPAGQDANAAAGEIRSVEWSSPAAALARAERGDIQMLPPTRAALQKLLPYSDVAAALEGLARYRNLTPILPKVSTDESGMKVLMPGDEGYDEAR